MYLATVILARKNHLDFGVKSLLKSEKIIVNIEIVSTNSVVIVNISTTQSAHIYMTTGTHLQLCR